MTGLNTKMGRDLEGKHNVQVSENMIHTVITDGLVFEDLRFVFKIFSFL